MSILPQLERDLLQAADRRLSGRSGSVGRASRRSGNAGEASRGRARRLWLALPAFGLLLTSATIALAAAGVILTGSPVRPNGPLNPAVGEGVPRPGRSRLLTLRAPDPAGGLPWGMRVLATTRGLVCLQVGRVQDGELGELGLDGAFHDDGRFHPLPADVLPADATSAMSENSSCHLAGQTFTGEFGGLDRNAATSPHTRTAPRQNLRNISYGTLGAHALSITYRTGGTQRTESVLPGIGAYLIVQQTEAHEPVATSGGGYGTGTPDGPRPNPDGALTAVTYSFGGKLCQDSVVLKVDDPCPLPRVARGEPRALAPRYLHRPVHVRLRLHGRLIVGAELSFTAPFAVTSAREGYTVAMPTPCHQGTDMIPVDRDVARGSRIHVSLPYPFANACGPTVPVEVRYSGHIGLGGMEAPLTVVGSATLRIPPGTRPAPPPVH
jgi:hypothetical protein